MYPDPERPQVRGRTVTTCVFVGMKENGGFIICTVLTFSGLKKGLLMSAPLFLNGKRKSCIFNRCLLASVPPLGVWGGRGGEGDIRFNSRRDQLDFF